MRDSEMNKGETMPEYSDIWKNHPEMRDGEILMTNTLCNGEETRWRTKRIGDVAYNVYGKQIHGRPVFVQKEELVAVGLNPETIGLAFILQGYKDGNW